MADSSFDIVSKIDKQEMDNALNQAVKEISQRYDFKNTGASLRWHGEASIEVTANADERALAVVEVLKEKVIKRGQSLKVLDVGEPSGISGNAQVGEHCQIEPSGNRGTVHCRHDGHGAAQDGVMEAVARLPQALLEAGVGLGELHEIEAGAEHGPRTGDDDDTNIRIGAEPVERVGHLVA